MFFKKKTAGTPIRIQFRPAAVLFSYFSPDIDRDGFDFVINSPLEDSSNRSKSLNEVLSRQKFYGTHFVPFYQVCRESIPFNHSPLIYNFTNISSIVEYCSTMPVTNAAVERILSTVYVLYADQKKNRFYVETIKSIIILKTHFKNYSCHEFHNILLIETKLLRAISSAQYLQKRKFTIHHLQNEVFFLYFRVHITILVVFQNYNITRILFIFFILFYLVK